MLPLGFAQLSNMTQNANPLKPLLSSLGNALNPPPVKKQGGKAKGKKATKMPRSQMMAQAQVAPLASTTIMRQNGSARANRPYSIVRREFIADVLGSTTTRINNYQINPGLSLFPWLAGIARAYDLYRFTRFRIDYVTHDTSQDKGKLVLSFDPNPDDPVPTTIARLENFETRAVNTPWANNYVDVPVADLNRLPKFMIRDALVPNSLTTYDLGSLSVGVAGTLDSALIGEIWFDYEVQFWAPQPLEDLTIIPQASSTTAYQQPSVAIVSATDFVVPWSGATITNPLRLVNTAGVFGGLRGALRVTAGVSISWLGSAPTAGTSLVAIQLSTNGGSTFADAFSSYYGDSAVGVESKSVSGVLLLIPSYQFRIRVVSTFGGTASISGPPASNYLIIAPA